MRFSLLNFRVSLRSRGVTVLSSVFLRYGLLSPREKSILVNTCAPSVATRIFLQELQQGDRFPLDALLFKCLGFLPSQNISSQCFSQLIDDVVSEYRASGDSLQEYLRCAGMNLRKALPGIEAEFLDALENDPELARLKGNFDSVATAVYHSALWEQLLRGRAVRDPNVPKKSDATSTGPATEMPPPSKFQIEITGAVN